MTQQSQNQFEDDLTVGMGESDDLAADSIDLFGTGDDESPIARLKSIILSIDWEITNEILQQLDEELLDLGEIWAGDKIKQVYVQGLSKIGKYIFKEKAAAHPDAIKLLITFFHNLEKIVTSDESMGEEEKKQLLLSDVKKFDQLKAHIGESGDTPDNGTADASLPSEPAGDAPAALSEETTGPGELKALKALVLGIDWEINDQELQKLGAEVQRLESLFGQNKAKLILLQGIGALSSYINKMRSKSNSSAFTLLHSFYNVLEQISGSDLSAAEEKNLLLAEVSKFNEFKAEIAKAQSDAAPAAPEARKESVPVSSESAETLDEEDHAVAADISSRLSSVFGEEVDATERTKPDSEESFALEGVNVETEADDDSDEEALPFDSGGIAPALMDADEDSSFSVEKLSEDLADSGPAVVPEAIVGDDIELEEDDEQVLPGVAVESEADDDSEEDSLPMEEGTFAPALSSAEDESGFNAERMSSEFDESDADAIENRLGAFFDDEVAESSEGWESSDDEEILQADEEISDDREGVVAALSDVFDEPVAETEEPEEVIAEAAESEEPVALQSKEDVDSLADESVEDFVADELSFLDEDVEDDDGKPVVLPEESDVPESVTPEEEALASFDQQFGVSDEAESEITLPGDTEDELPAGEEEKTEQQRAEDFVEEELSFFDDGDEGETVQQEVATDHTEEQPQTPDEGITFEVESDDLGDEDEIKFSLPGEEDIVDTETEVGEQVLEESSGEVVFEAVADDVELDQLPGEEFADTASDFISAPVMDRYKSLAALSADLQKNVADEGLQNISVELDSLREAKEISFTDKTFLQLLSSMCQYLAKNKTNAEGLQLMGDIVAGLELSDGSGATSEKVQEELFNCTGRILRLQQKEINGSVADDTQERVVPGGVAAGSSEKTAFQALGDDEQLASFVQREIADIRKLFADEIGSIRKELAEK